MNFCRILRVWDVVSVILCYYNIIWTRICCVLCIFPTLVEACKHEQTIWAHYLLQHATFEISIKWPRVNSCALCWVKSIVPLVISMTLYNTESLHLHSNNDISSQFQANIMPKRKRERISDPAKNKQSLPTCIIRVTSLSDHCRCTALSQVSDTLQQICEIRDKRGHTFPIVDSFLISYAI